MRLLLSVILAAAILAVAHQVQAQTDSGGPRAALLGGVLVGDGPHAFMGGEAGVTYWRTGVFATGFFGRGNGFDSLLLEAGPVLRIVQRGRTDLYLTVGMGNYRETLDTGFTRSVRVVTGGVSGRVPAGPVRVAVSVLGWSGNFGGLETVAGGVPVNGVRLAVGVAR